MITASIAFLIIQTGSQYTGLNYFSDIFKQFTGSDILISTFMSGNSSFLNEVPMADYLDSQQIEQADGSRSIVDDYTFVTINLDDLYGSADEIFIQDVSGQNVMTVNMYSTASNYKAVTKDKFYVPSEVNGMPGENLITGEKIDAHKALYDFEQTKGIYPVTTDPYSLLQTYDTSYLTETKLPTIPILISEGLRNVLSIDTGDNDQLMLQNNFDVKPAKVVGLMAKLSHSAFTARKV